MHHNYNSCSQMEEADFPSPFMIILLTFRSKIFVQPKIDNSSSHSKQMCNHNCASRCNRNYSVYSASTFSAHMSLFSNGFVHNVQNDIFDSFSSIFSSNDGHNRNVDKDTCNIVPISAMQQTFVINIFAQVQSGIV